MVWSDVVTLCIVVRQPIDRQKRADCRRLESRFPNRVRSLTIRIAIFFGVSKGESQGFRSWPYIVAERFVKSRHAPIPRPRKLPAQFFPVRPGVRCFLAAVNKDAEEVCHQALSARRLCWIPGARGGQPHHFSQKKNR